jgi:ribonucleotide reductase alpha subunit
MDCLDSVVESSQNIIYLHGLQKRERLGDGRTVSLTPDVLLLLSRINWKMLRETVHFAVRVLNNAIEMSVFPKSRRWWPKLVDRDLA